MFKAGRVIAIDTRDPKPESWKEIIPQAEETLDNVRVVGNRFIASYLKDAHTQVKVHEIDGTFVREVELPGLGTATGFSGKRSDPETFYAYVSFTTPATIYRHEVASGRSTVFRKPRLAFDPDDYETAQVFSAGRGGNLSSSDARPPCPPRSRQRAGSSRTRAASAPAR